MDQPTKLTSKTKSSSSSKSKMDDKQTDEKPKKDDKRTDKNTKTEDKYSSDILRQKLHEYFNHKDFKSTLQKDAIKEIMRGKRDVYISMPTGSGKSLCFQFPGMLHENKITLVFSPLIALIKDQLDHLTKLKICAESLNSKMTMKERERVINDLKSIRPSTKFLYITPEQAATDFFRTLLDHIVKYNKLALIAAIHFMYLQCHCVSEMGHDFRRDYLKLGQLRARYPTVKWIALTATASREVTNDIFKQLALKEPKSFKTPCFRKNLFYDIVYKNSIQDDYGHLKEFILKCLKTKSEEKPAKPNDAPCGIVYCRTREAVERVAVGLTKQNIVAKAYHAGLNDRDRKHIQEDWTNGKFAVICATLSFGMGVDKATVRFVVHWDCPQNIAAYYQESGRAGRDGKLSYCRLYYCRQEVKSINFLLNSALQKAPESIKAKRSIKEFDQLVEHCESLRCRHLLFSNYFGDAPPDCKKRHLCDVCKDPKKAEKILETFHKLGLNGFISKMDVDFNDTSDLYEGGRGAAQNAAASYYEDDDSGEGTSSKREAKAKKETTNLIQKEFERRKQKIEAAKKLEETQTRSFGIRVKSSIHTTSKIPGLDVKKRESFLDFLLKILRENAEKATQKPAHQLKSCDYEDIAAEIEYNCFTKNRVMSMYTRAITNERARIGKATKENELVPEIKNHIPKKRTAHGGSAEAMQRELDSFMKQHSIDDETNSNQPSVKPTHSNVGFQTARQINNKLKEPNRMKKDPLTQTSINSFFSAGSIKREPEENMGGNINQSNNLQNAKRRKIDDSTENGNVKIKTEPVDEPMDTDNNGTLNDGQLPVKSEPIDYASDAGTDTPSDDDDDARTIIYENQACQSTDRSGAKPDNEPMDSCNDLQPPIKVELDYSSDAGTDTPSDDEGYSGNHGDVPSEPSESSEPLVRVKTEPGLTLQTEPSVEPSYVKESEPEPSVAYNRQTIKNEPDDDPIDSDEETDDDDEKSNVSEFNKHTGKKDQSIRSKGGLNEGSSSDATAEQHQLDDDPEVDDDDKKPNVAQLNKLIQKSSSSQFNKHIDADVQKKERNKERINDGNFSAARAEQHQSSSWHQQPSTSHQQASSPVHSASHTNQPFVSREYQSKPVTTADGARLIRLSYFDPVAVEPQQNFVQIIDDDDIDMDDLGDEIAKYTDSLEKQYNEKWEQMKQLNIEILNQDQLKELKRRCEELKRKTQNIITQKTQEMRKTKVEEKEKKRDVFLQDLFGLYFDISEFERKIKIKESYSEPSTSSGTSSRSSTDKKDNKITYSDFMNKPKIKPDHEKSAKQHHLGMAINEHVNRMSNANMLDLVPKRAIDSVRQDKTIIKNKVERYLMPYYSAGVLDRKKYELMCKQITHDCYETNIYDSETIRRKVETVVKIVTDALNRKRPTT